MPALDFDKLFEKQPGEQATIKLDLSNIFSSFIILGYELHSAEIKIFNDQGGDLSDSMIEGNIFLDAENKCVYVTIKNGTDDENYFGRCKSTWKHAGEPDQNLESDFLIQVKQKGF